MRRFFANWESSGDAEYMGFRRCVYVVWNTLLGMSWENSHPILLRGQEYYFLIIEGSFAHRFLMDQRFRESDFNY